VANGHSKFEKFVPENPVGISLYLNGKTVYDVSNGTQICYRCKNPGFSNWRDAEDRPHCPLCVDVLEKRFDAKLFY
jgi:hypothetical protein